jgi:uncharacterized protein YkwD
MSSPVLTGRPARPTASQPGRPDPSPGRPSPGHREPGPGHRPPRRPWYLLGVPLLVSALVIGGLYLTRGSPSAPPRAALALASPSAAASPPPDACGAAATGPCAQHPIHVGIARVPHSPTRARTARGAASSPAASSRSGSATSPASRPSGSATSPTASSPSATSPAPAQQGTPAGQVLALINQARSAAGLPPLTMTAGLDASASAHNLKMADGCGLTHQCPGEPAIGARETAAGVDWTAAGENIGEGGPEPDTTADMAQMAVTLTQDMLNEQPPDDGHRLNILSSTFTHIGIAVHRDTSGTVWLTQDFSN